ncbi:MAG: hypothetical protein E7282_02600 [Lachnospiraceae bacterium]|nr:hypothetical protein [Lachnospiraceae bacterium]
MGNVLNIYLVENSFHLKEGLDSEFLVIAKNEEHAKEECLRMLAEDQGMHLERVKEDIESLKRGVAKYDNTAHTDDPADQFMRRAIERNKETIIRLSNLVNSFTGYKAECLKVKKINPRLKNGQVQFDNF